MRPAPLRPAAVPAATPAHPQRYLTNDEAADYLRLSPRTLEKQRVIGGGPSGYGLVGMRERAKLLGGTFHAGPSAGGGWRVEAILPRAGAPR